MSNSWYKSSQLLTNQTLPLTFIKAHIGVIGNESADAIAKHAALHDYGHDKAFPSPSLDGDPFSRIYWLEEENNETTHTTTRISLAPYKTLRIKLT